MTGKSHTEPPILTSLSDGVGIIELARPAVFNCMSLEMMSMISAGLERFERGVLPEDLSVIPHLTHDGTESSCGR